MMTMINRNQFCKVECQIWLFLMHLEINYKLVAYYKTFNTTKSIDDDSVRDTFHAAKTQCFKVPPLLHSLCIKYLQEMKT